MTSNSNQIAAVIALLAERWPACFAIYQGDRKPLKVGIHLEIIAAFDAENVFVVARPLQRTACAHVGNTGWLRRRTFAQSFCGRIVETSLQTTIRLCSMPSRLGEMPEFGGCQQRMRG